MTVCGSTGGKLTRKAGRPRVVITCRTWTVGVNMADLLLFWIANFQNFPTGMTHDLQIVIASIRPNDHEASRTFTAGSSGYLHAYSPIPVLESALQSVSAGSVWMGRSLVNRILQEIDRRLKPGQESKGQAWADSLTLREKEVAQRAAVGRSNQEIADELGITERTVRAHMTAIFEKLGVADRLTLALKVHGISAN